MSIVIKNIKLNINKEQIRKKLHIKKDSKHHAILFDLIKESKDIANPKIIFDVLNIDQKGEDFVIVKKALFTSKILRKNFSETERVFPHIITCGIELEKWSKTKKDIFVNFIAEEIKSAYLVEAINHFNRHIDEEFPGKKSTVNPGSLVDWCVSEQKKIFDLLANVTESIDVTIEDSALMIPIKSLSGITYFSEISFENCQLCKREKCPGRRAAFIPSANN